MLRVGRETQAVPSADAPLHCGVSFQLALKRPGPLPQWQAGSLPHGPTFNQCRNPDMGHQNVVSGRFAGEDVLELVHHFATAFLAPSLAPSLAPFGSCLPIPVSHAAREAEIGRIRGAREGAREGARNSAPIALGPEDVAFPRCTMSGALQ